MFCFILGLFRFRSWFLRHWNDQFWTLWELTNDTIVMLDEGLEAWKVYDVIKSWNQFNSDENLRRLAFIESLVTTNFLTASNEKIFCYYRICVPAWICINEKGNVWNEYIYANSTSLPPFCIYSKHERQLHCLVSKTRGNELLLDLSSRYELLD